MKTNEKRSGSGVIKTPKFRVSFPAVIEPREVMGGNGVKKYSISMLFDTTDPAVKKGLDEVVKPAIRAAVVAKWGADQTKWPKGLRMPLRNGTEKDYDGYGEGIVFASATSKMRPGLVDAAVQPIMEEGEFYAGCYARATINAYAYEKAGNRGVAFGLRNIQKIADGEPFSGKSKPEDDFDALDTAATAPVAGKPAATAPVAGKPAAVEEDPLGL